MDFPGRGHVLLPYTLRYFLKIINFVCLCFKVSSKDLDLTARKRNILFPAILSHCAGSLKNLILFTVQRERKRKRKQNIA